MTSEVGLRCRQRACTVGLDGKCLDGFGRPAECPSVMAPRGSQAPWRDVDPDSDAPGGWIDLPDGADLDSRGAERIARAAISRVILVAGPADSGKTTLLAAVYEAFQRGPFARCLFAGSETLLGFERRCHLARIESGRAVADTARTLNTGGLRWLHLRVRPADAEEAPRDLLVSEIPGDVFRLAKDSTDECRRLTTGRRADHFAILVDGAKLVQRQHRLTATNDAALFLRSCLDAEMLGPASFVDILVTKWDLAARAPEASEIDHSVSAFVERTRQHCEGRLGRLRFLRVAARPLPRSELSFAHGLTDVVASWVTESPRFRVAPPMPVPVPEGASEFDRYLWRQLPALRPGRASGNGAAV
jgi:hypothetical protein